MATSFLVCLICRLLSLDPVFDNEHNVANASLVLAVSAVLGGRRDDGPRTAMRKSMYWAAARHVQHARFEGAALDRAVLTLLQTINFVTTFVDYDERSLMLRSAFLEWNACRGALQGGLAAFEGRVMRSLFSKPKAENAVYAAFRACFGESHGDCQLALPLLRAVSHRGHAAPPAIIKQVLSQLDGSVASSEQLRDELPTLLHISRLVSVHGRGTHPVQVGSLFDGLLPFAAWPDPYGRAAVRALHDIRKELVCPGRTFAEEEVLIDMPTYVIVDGLHGDVVEAGPHVRAAALVRLALMHEEVGVGGSSGNVSGEDECGGLCAHRMREFIQHCFEVCFVCFGVFCVFV